MQFEGLFHSFLYGDLSLSAKSTNSMTRNQQTAASAILMDNQRPSSLQLDSFDPFLSFILPDGDVKVIDDSMNAKARRFNEMRLLDAYVYLIPMFH